jgi:hypothetical protein
VFLPRDRLLKGIPVRLLVCGRVEEDVEFAEPAGHLLLLGEEPEVKQRTLKVSAAMQNIRLLCS